MSESSSSAVDCPVCGEAFDPTDAGGWCTNSDCGEWQYIGEEVPEPAESAGDGTGPVDIARGPPGDDGDDAADASDDATEDANESETAAEPAEPTPAIRRIETADADGTGAAEETAGAGDADEAAESGDDAPSPDAAEDASADPDGLDCPECGTAVEEDDNFCPGCGADLAEATTPTLAECPGCGSDVDADDSFCAACGEDLDAARESLESAAAADDVTAQPADEGSAADAGSEAASESAPPSLVLRCRGEEIAVADDETVGREVRRILTKAGAEEDEAVRIHREHVRFVREDDQFYLVDLGDNPTVLNGRYLSKGDREPIGPGDELELSDVATLSVESP